jgi:hypothetical protein
MHNINLGYWAFKAEKVCYHDFVRARNWIIKNVSKFKGYAFISWKKSSKNRLEWAKSIDW